MMKDYIERERIEKFFDGIYGCAELIFEPNDHCCAEDDCAHCKWYETMNAIRKRIFSIPAADVQPVVRGEWELDSDGLPICSNCGEIALQRVFVKVPHLIQDVRMVKSNYCPNCGADMRGDDK